jgi:murein DD-endopeptidase MepM/ murein hydrolase activator NlpD
VDNSTFDAVARAVAAGASRRQVLRLLAIGTVTAWLPGRARAAPARQDCAAAGLTDCAGVCADLSSDPNNCGGCGVVCEGCAGGTCPQVSLGCVSPLVECAGVCADFSSDPFNCGGCGSACESGVCEGGICAPVQVSLGCVAPMVECAGLCADLSSDPNHCGACGNACASGVCGGGICNQVVCDPGFTYCEAFGACYDLTSDATHCGACDITCPSGGASAHECIEGNCVATGCAAPFVDCDGECIDFSDDPNHCGACDTMCAGGTCIEGVCAPLTCEAGFTYCVEDDACFNLATDPVNCGICGTVCESGVCTSGVCGESIAAPATPAAPSDTTPATPAVPTPTSTPPTESAPARTPKPRRDRASRRQGTGSGSSPADTTSGAAKQAKQAKVKKAAASKGSEPVIVWPIDPEAGQWTIVNGYRGEDEHAPLTNNDQNYALFALDFAVCRPENVDVADGTCELGPVSASGEDASEPGWDTKATRGANVLSPVDGTVAWTEEANAPCPSVGFDIKGHPGYRLALFNVDGRPELGQSVKRGKKIGKVAKGGCEGGDHVHMVLYQPQAGVADDPVERRKGVPFTGDWTIAGCDFPDDKQTTNQYRGVLVPCNPEDQVSGGA